MTTDDCDAHMRKSKEACLLPNAKGQLV
jgi:hypothetical protein